MRRRALNVIVMAGVLTLAGGGLAAAAQARSAPAAPSGVLVPTNSHEALPVHGGTVDSLNWSGYAVTGSGINGVSSTFVVPSAGLAPPGFAATWTGIGGYSTSDLIQAGVAEDSTPSNSLLGPQYYAWYELLPASETQLTNCDPDPSCTVSPGDTVSVSITSAGTNEWTISMDNSGHWTWSDTVSYTSSESSAEWILEAPTLVVAQTLLADVGTVDFGPTSTFSDGSGGGQTIAAGSPTQIDLSPGVVNEATPSALASNGQSFNDCSYAQTCAAP